MHFASMRDSETERKEEESGPLESASDYGSFPVDLITEHAKDHGAIIVHMLVGLYMFYGIAVVCDDFFVSSLEVIIERLQVKEDVAGATFMAAGGSAPELFTSVIGTFIAQSDVGFGTIVGSAVFNVLFVIGICAFGSGQVLNLDWFPLSRDSIYYAISLLVIVVFVWDQSIKLYEAFLLFIMYLGYIVVMYFNEDLETWAKKKFSHKVLGERRSSVAKSAVLPAPDEKSGTEEESNGNGKSDGTSLPADGQRDNVASADKDKSKSGSEVPKPKAQLPPLKIDSPKRLDATSSGSLPSGRKELPPLRNSPKKRLSGNEVVALAEPAITAADSASAESKAETLADIDAYPPRAATESEPVDWSLSHKRQSNSQDGLLANVVSHRASDAEKPLIDMGLDERRTGNSGSGQAHAARSGSDSPASKQQHTLLVPDSAREKSRSGDGKSKDRSKRLSWSSHHTNDTQKKKSQTPKNEPEGKHVEHEEEDDEEDENPFEWPDKPLDRFFFILKVPLLGLLYYTIPDCRKESHEKYFVVTFLLSLVWIAAFTWLMVWMATEIGITLGIPPPVMGLTILAAGTSVPDAVSSLVVAKQGFGDMAVSSSIGSNIFDILVGLPIPWIFYSAIIGPVGIDSGTLAISVAILLAMVVAVVVSIHLNHWVLTPRLGFVMVVLYVIFVTISLLLEYNVIA